MRLFIAIQLAGSVRNAVGRLQEKLRAGAAGVRWVKLQNVHLTVKFLGEIDASELPRIRQALQEAAASAGPFEMAVSGCGVFPSAGRVRVIWAGVESKDGGALACYQAIEDALAQVGVSREQRGFSPHITLGRVREDRSGGSIRSAVDAASLPPQPQHVRELVLMESTLAPSGPTYTVVTTAALGRSERQDTHEAMH